MIDWNQEIIAMGREKEKNGDETSINQKGGREARSVRKKSNKITSVRERRRGMRRKKNQHVEEARAKKNGRK